MTEEQRAEWLLDHGRRQLTHLALLVMVALLVIFGP